MTPSPVLIFVYNRPLHTQECIHALQQNRLARETDLFIYADAPEKPDSKAESVRAFIRSIQGFKSVSIIERKSHYGLARSIISGVTDSINAYGNAIVLEDDLVTSPFFLTYMNDALKFYKNNKNIFSISGYNYPPETLKIPENYKNDVFLSYRPSSWGWATWEDRWGEVDWGISDYDQFINTAHEQKQFNRGGDDLTPMLKDFMRGRIDSWAIRFCYAHYKTGAYALFPVCSYVDNIGFDTTGTHPSPPFTCSNDVSTGRPKCEFVELPSIDHEIAARFRNIFSPKPPPRSLKSSLYSAFCAFLRPQKK